MAAVAITFARYFLELTNLHAADGVVAALALAVLTIVNCLGVRAGGTVQSFPDGSEDTGDRRTCFVWSLSNGSG